MVDKAEKTQHDIVSPSFRDLENSQRLAERKGARDLIASDQVEGASVYRPNGDKIGKVHYFMVSKRSGQVE